MVERVPVTSEPLNAETPLPALSEMPTPSDLVYIRNHFAMPRLTPRGWNLEIKGLAGPPRSLRLSDIQTYPYDEIEMVLECAGNGRKAMDPVPEGTPWGLGAVSQVRFGGTPLRNLLPDPATEVGAVEVVFTGADHGRIRSGQDVHFERSLPVEAALERHTLVAWTMNGEALTPENGFPLRLVVPGWYGMASVKWLRRVQVVDRPFHGHFQANEYVYRGEAGIPDHTPVRHIRPRALVLSPAENSQREQGVLAIRGVAWSGLRAIASVLVSTDGGASWTDADLERRDHGFEMQRWQMVWETPGPGEYTILARAVAAGGETQPLEPRQNRLGYGNNSVHSVRVFVR